MNEPRCRLYLIAPSPMPEGFAAVLADALQGGDVAALRLAAGGMEDAEFLAALIPVRRVAQEAGVAVILDGRPDLVARSACDGVHLDAPLPGMRRTLGDLQLGMACGLSRDLAMQAGEAGADYVSFGPFFGPDAGMACAEADARDALPDDLAYATTGPEILSWWVELMELPAVAEGGITLENCPALIAAGADFIAVAEAVWTHADGPRAAVRAFNAAIRAHAPDA